MFGPISQTAVARRDFSGPVGFKYRELGDAGLREAMHKVAYSSLYENLPEDLEDELKQHVATRLHNSYWFRKLSREHGSLTVEIELFPRQFSLGFRYTIYTGASEAPISSGQDAISHRDVLDAMQEHLSTDQRAAILERANKP